ncbi:MAG: DUF3800 domain-containing protein [Dehalococcoidia bacterium]
MTTHKHWIVFADDTGDPGPAGSAHFGYAMVAVPRDQTAWLTELRARFRVDRKMFVEAKPKRLTHPNFVKVLADVSDACESRGFLVAATGVMKTKYRGPWLQPSSGVPADSNFFRNYLVRKSLELLFDGTDFEPVDHVDLVLDRVGQSAAQTANVHRYLNGAFTEYGAFKFPAVKTVTHADSLYVEGLQVADHLARLARGIWEHDPAANGLVHSLRLCSILSAREFQVSAEARSLLKGHPQPPTP